MPRQVSNLIRFRSVRNAAAVAVMVALLALASPIAAQEGAFTITVEGVGTAAGEPNLASLDLGVEVVGTDLESALTEVDETIDAITQALLVLDVVQPDIWNTGDVITPQDINDAATGAVTGTLLYHVRGILSVTVNDVAQVQSVIRAAVGSGANVVNNLTLGIDDLTALERQARQAAIANAYVRAQALAAGFNLVLSDPIIVTETLDNDGLPIPFSADSIRAGMYAPAGDSGSTSPLLLTVRVQVVFRTQRQDSAS